MDELRIALLLGKPVEIIMPPQAMRTLKARVETDKASDKTSVTDDIDRVVNRIDVTQASASFSGDRDTVLDQLDGTIGVMGLGLTLTVSLGGSRTM